MSTKQKTPVAPDVAQNMSSAEILFGIPKAVQKIAKLNGCTAFRGQRIHRAELLKWLKSNKKIVTAAEAAAADKESDASMKRERLAIQIKHAQLNLDHARGELIPKVESQGTWDQCAAIVQEEAKALMERDHYRIFLTRTQARLNSILVANEQIKGFAPGRYDWDGETWTPVSSK